MKLHIWDVQHGSAAYLQTPNNRHVAIDLGIGDLSQRDECFSPLRLLKRMGVPYLHQVIITHPHRDHLDDIFNFDLLSPSVLYTPRNLTENQIRAGNRPGEQPILDKYFEISRRYNEPVSPNLNLHQSENWGMVISCHQATGCPPTNLNNHSIVTFLQHADSTVCLPGDNESPSWRELLQDISFRAWLRETDILVAAHHGREAGFCEDIFEYCKPRLIVVSDGPAGDTSAVSRYGAKAQGWTVWSRSRRTGEERLVVTTRCDGSVFISTGYDGAQRFLNVTVE